MKRRSPAFSEEDWGVFAGMYERGEPWPVIERWQASRGYSCTRDTLFHLASNKGVPRGRKVPGAMTKRWSAPPKINENCVLFLDCHIPYHDAAFMGHVAEVASAWGVKHAIMDEDAIDLDWLSKFERAGSTPDQEIRAYRNVIDSLLEWLEHLHLHAGNHGARVRRTVQAMSQENRDLLNVSGDPLENIFIHRKEMELTDYAYCIVHGQAIVGHPTSASRYTALYVAESYRMNAYVGHTHYRSHDWTRDDRYEAVEVGMCADPKRLRYVGAKLHGRTRGLQRQGAAILVKGDDGELHGYHLTPRSDWEALKRLYPAQE